jgi:general secretion pathway protein D
VVIEMELLEVNKSRMRRLGIMPVGTDFNPLYRAGVIADPAGRSDDDERAGGIRGFFPSLDDEDFLTIVPAIAIDFLKEHGDSKQVANPHLRVTSGETGFVRIGQSIPIAQTSFTNAQLSGSASGSNDFGDQALTSFRYNDVGISINVVPRVHYNNEITLLLELEISSVISGGLQPILGKREVKTSIRLKNGEVNVMAGLLSNDERKSLLGLPGLSDIPVLGRLFSNDEKVISQTDIIMTTRPIIIRAPNISKRDRAPYELSSLRLSSLFGSAEEQAAAEKEAGKDRERGGTIKLEGRDEGDAVPAPPPIPLSPSPAGDAEQTEEQPYYQFKKPYQPDGAAAEPPPLEEPIDTEPTPAMLAFTPTLVEGRQDDLLDFQLFIANAENLKRGEITLEFNPEILQVEAVDLGNFFSDAGAQPLLTPAWDNATGRLSMVITQRHGAGTFSGAGIMAYITMRAKAPGSGDLTFLKILLQDDQQQSLEADGLPAAYEVAP